MKSLLFAIAVLVSAPIAPAGELSQGPPIDARDLASLLGIFNVSIDYQQEAPFSKLTAELAYKTPQDDGTYATEKSLVGCSVNLRESATTQTIKVLVSDDACRVSMEKISSGSDGIELPSHRSTRNPPEQLEDGSFVLLTGYQETGKDEIVGLLTLTITASE